MIDASYDAWYDILAIDRDANSYFKYTPMQTHISRSFPKEHESWEIWQTIQRTSRAFMNTLYPVSLLIE